MVRPTITTTVLGLAMAGVAGQATAGSYTYQSIDPPHAVTTIVAGINDAGVVVGTFNNGDSEFGFVMKDGAFSMVQARGTYSAFEGINKAGIAVGTAGDQPFVYDTNTGSTRLPPTGPAYPVGIDDAGDILANYGYGCGYAAALYQAHTYASTCLLPPGYTESMAVAIDGDGLVLGTVGAHHQTGFLYDHGTYTIIPPPLGATPPADSYPAFDGLGSTGAVLGDVQRGPGRHSPFIGFVYYNGRFSSVRPPAADNVKPSAALARQIIVGIAAAQGGSYGFLKMHGQSYQLAFPLGSLDSINGINAAGTLVGNYRTGAGYEGAFIATCAPDQQPCTQ